MLINCDDIKVTKEEDTRTTINCSETIILSLLEYYNAKKIDEKIENEEIESDTNVSDNELPEDINQDYSDSNVEGNI